MPNPPPDQIRAQIRAIDAERALLKLRRDRLSEEIDALLMASEESAGTNAEPEAGR